MYHSSAHTVSRGQRPHRPPPSVELLSVELSVELMEDELSVLLSVEVLRLEVWVGNVDGNTKVSAAVLIETVVVGDGLIDIAPEPVVCPPTGVMNASTGSPTTSPVMPAAAKAALICECTSNHGFVVRF